MIADGQIKGKRQRDFLDVGSAAERCGRRERNAGKGHGVCRQSFSVRWRRSDRVAKTPNLLPPRYTGFVAKDNSYYRPIRDAGLRQRAVAGQLSACG